MKSVSRVCQAQMTSRVHSFPPCSRLVNFHPHPCWRIFPLLQDLQCLWTETWTKHYDCKHIPPLGGSLSLPLGSNTPQRSQLCPLHQRPTFPHSLSTVRSRCILCTQTSKRCHRFRKFFPSFSPGLSSQARFPQITHTFLWTPYFS